MLANREVGLGHVRVENRRSGAHRQRPGDQFDRPAGISTLVVHDAEKMKRIGMVRLASEQGVVETSGIRIAPLPMKIQGEAELRIHGCNLQELIAWRCRVCGNCALHAYEVSDHRRHDPCSASHWET